jgi:peptidoglycan hydrolase-like protein with peptidoglycan-binding domain
MARLVILPATGMPLGKRWLTLGDQGQDVRQLQEVLARLGLYEGEETGEYDLLTREAVKAFQKAYCLAVDGVCGPDTCKLLLETGIFNRILGKTEAGDSITSLAAKYGVGCQAFKDPETRRRLRQVETGRPFMLERREIIMGITEQGRAEIEKGGANDGGLGIIQYVKPQEFKALVSNYIHPPSVWVLDLTAESLPAKKRKILQRLRQKSHSELFWWLSTDHQRFPTAEEADALIISVPVFVSDHYNHGVWQQEIKKILTHYPCTRLLVHFDLRAKEMDANGTQRILTAAESKIARLNRTGDVKRVGEYGWIYYHYRWRDEERAVLLPDHLTIRGMMYHLDHINLRGILLTGADFWWEGWQAEGNRYFLATPRILVMKRGALA